MRRKVHSSAENQADLVLLVPEAFCARHSIDHHVTLPFSQRKQEKVTMGEVQGPKIIITNS